MTPERLAEIRQFAEAYRGTGLVRRRPNSAIAHRGELLAHINELADDAERLRKHQERLRSFITPRHRYDLAIDGDAIALRCTDHGDEIARWIGEPYPFQPIDDAAHAHEVWQHPGELRLVDESHAPDTNPKD